MARRTANRLYVEDIDEVSSVDIPANQHGLIAIAKRAGDIPMDEFFDEQGNPVDPTGLEPGARVFDAEGNSFTVADDEAIDEALAAGRITEDDIVDLDTADPDDSLDDNDPRLDEQHNSRDDELVGAVGKRGRGPVRKRNSLGQQVLSELRKSLTDADRDQVLARALDMIEEANERAARAEALATRVGKRFEGGEYVELAKSYDALPVESTELGSLLQKAAGTFSKRELATFERILEVAQDGGVALDELGYSGVSHGSGIHDEVSAMAAEVVGKANGALTPEQAIAELYSANPEAYEAYSRGE